MLAKKVAVASKNLLDPDAAEWQEAPLDIIAMAATPIANQPNDYLKISWENRQFGVVKELRVRVLHNGLRIFFRLEWDRSHPQLPHYGGYGLRRRRGYPLPPPRRRRHHHNGVRGPDGKRLVLAGLLRRPAEERYCRWCRHRPAAGR